MQTDDSIKAHRHPRRGLLALPLAVALLAMASFSAYAQDAAVLAFSEGLLFDGSRSTIYAMESDALTARAADSGERLWSRPELAEPMALHQGRLLVLGRRDQPREPVAFWLDPATGATIGEFKLDLPEAVSFLISERPGERFQAQAFVDGGELVLHWHYVQRQLIGAPAVAGVNRAVKMPRLSGDSPSPAGGSAPIVDTTLVEESGLFRVRSNSATAIDRAEMGIAQFNRWEKLFGEARQQAADGEQYRSRSGGHVLASRLVDDEGWLRHQWTLIGEEGESLGQFRLPVAFAPFAVGDKVLAYESQPYIRFEGGDVLEARDLSLVVMDLESGRERWQTALLDKTWREGMPP
jgi:hypothetical protein